jgi:hypothetical protein
MEMRMSAGALEACRRISLWILPDDEVSFMPDRVKAIGGRKKKSLVIEDHGSY